MVLLPKIKVFRAPPTYFCLPFVWQNETREARRMRSLKMRTLRNKNLPSSVMALSSLTYYKHVSRYLPSPPSTLYVFNKHYFVHIVYIIINIYKSKRKQLSWCTYRLYLTCWIPRSGTHRRHGPSIWTARQGSRGVVSATWFLLVAKAHIPSGGGGLSQSHITHLKFAAYSHWCPHVNYLRIITS
jgi:hypothetical protein